MKKTITVGIPAYNESANIVFLIKEIFKQKLVNFKLKNIIVASDGSTDDTVKKVNSIQDCRIMVIRNKVRKGAYAMQNQIFEKADSDIVVLLNADISLQDVMSLEVLCTKLVLNNADLVSGQIIPLATTSFLGKCLSTSVFLKENLFSNYKSGNNVYTCHGPMRAFSQVLYKDIRFPELAGEDAFSYFYAVTKAFKYAYEPKAKCIYKVPEKFNEHEKQSIRFEKSKNSMANIFGNDITYEEYSIPFMAFIKAFAITFIKRPLYLTCFIGINLFTKMKSFVAQPGAAKWEMVASSKTLH